MTIEDCGKDGVCATPTGCHRHWEELQRELEAVRDERDDLTAEARRDGWKGQRCHVCRRWTWGGPTACAWCTDAEERARAEYDRGRADGRADVGKYANAIGRIDCALGRVVAMPLDDTVAAVEALVRASRQTTGHVRAAAEEAMHALLHVDAHMNERLEVAKAVAEALALPWPPYPVLEMCEWCEEPVTNGGSHGEGNCFDSDDGGVSP